MPSLPFSSRTSALRVLTAGTAAMALWVAAPAAAQLAPRVLSAPAPLAHLVPAQTTASTDLVQIFADWMDRHPIGSTVPPSQARVLDASDLPAGLPALAPGRRYAEFDGMIVEIDAAYKLIRLVRRAPAPPAAPTTTTAAPTPTAPAPAPLPAAPAPAPAPSSGATADANANATANVTVNVITGDEDEEGGDDHGDGASRALTIAEAEAQGIRIPRGHQPEPGTCRLWFPGTPPGRQPRGGASCEEDDIPDGAFLIRG